MAYSLHFSNSVGLWFLNFNYGKKMSEENDKKENNENTDETSELEEQKGLGKKKLIIIFAGAGLLIIIVAVVLFFLLFGKNKEEEKLEDAVNKQDAAGVPVQDFYPDLFKLEEVKLKLAPEEGSEVEKYLRLSFYTKFKTPEDKFVLSENAELLKNRIASLFESKKPSDIDEIHEKILLKKEIIRLISDILKKDSVENIYYSEFLILDW